MSYIIDETTTRDRSYWSQPDIPTYSRWKLAWKECRTAAAVVGSVRRRQLLPNVIDTFSKSRLADYVSYDVASSTACMLCWMQHQW